MTMTTIDPNAGGSAARNTRGRVPVFSPRLNDAPLDVSPVSLQMTMTEGQHDTGTLSVVSTTLETTDDILDSPISFYFGAPPRTELFQGYVANVTDEQNAQGQLSFTMQVIGPTKAMYEGKPRFWVNRTATGVTSDLINNAGLGVGGHSHSHIWKSLAQTEESDWSMVMECAKRIGWTVFNRYGVVFPLDPLRAFREHGVYARLVAGQNDIGEVNDRTLLEFSSTTLSEMTKDNLGSKFGFFNTSNDVQMLTQTGDFAGFVFESTQLIRDQEEAQTYLKAYETRADGWAESGVARIWGDADLWPGMCVHVLTSSKRYYTPKGDGKWFVRAVGHQADRQQYQTILFLTRPQKDPTPGYTEQPYKPFWELQDPPKSRPSLSLRDKRWFSTWNDNRLRGLI